MQKVHAEGSGRKSKNEQKHFYYISRGSLYECIALINISNDLKFIKDEMCMELKIKSQKILAQLNGLIKYTNRPDNNLETKNYEL